MCELTLQMILSCFCLLLLIVFNIGLQCNLLFLNTTVLQGSVATWVNDGGIFDNFFIANLLLSVSVKNFEDRLGCGKVVAKNKVAPFFPDTVYMRRRRKPYRAYAGILDKSKHTGSDDTCK